MSSRLLRRATLYGLIATPVVGILLFALLVAGFDLLSGWWFLLTPAFVLGFIPLLVGRAALYQTALRNARQSCHVIWLITCWFVCYSVIFYFLPILDESTLRQALVQGLAATATMILLHGLIVLTISSDFRGSRSPTTDGSG